MRVAYLTGHSHRGLPIPPGELPAHDARDFQLARTAAASVGVALEPAYWDDPDLARRGYDGALIRSCWDYSGQLERFLRVLGSHVRAGLRLFNPPPAVVWNSQKTYLRELGAAGVPVIPTMWLDRPDAGSIEVAFERFETSELVLKPQVGAGSRATLRLERGRWSEADLARGPESHAMLQPFLPAIETEGEIGLVYFGGLLSHAIRKTPVSGGWLANDLGAKLEEIVPPAGAESLALQALEAAPRDVLYARIDLVRGRAGEWRLIELELIEPRFYLPWAPAGAEALARALARALAPPALA